jgi:hypothetical protein
MSLCIRLAAVAGVALMATASIASAETFAWSYTGTHGYVVTASGTLTATALGGGAYAVTSITGMRNGVSIDGLSAYAGSDNEVFTTDPHLDYPGLAFLSGGSAFNTYFDGTDGPPGTGGDGYACGFAGYCEIGPGVPGTSGLDGPDPIHSIDFTLTLTSVPEPATWALMLLGFGGMGAALRRRRTPAVA